MMNGRGRPLEQTQTEHYQLQIIPGSVDMLQLHQRNPQRYPYLLQSVKMSAQHNYDILFAFPQQQLILKNNEASLNQQPQEGDFLQNLDRCWSQDRCQLKELPLLPFSGGWFVYLGYELAQQIEPTLNLHADPCMPTAIAVRVPAAILHDRVEKRMLLIAEPGYENELKTMRADLGDSSAALKVHDAKLIDQWVEDPAEEYIAKVSRIKDYILEGDVFQVNLSRRWRAQLTPRATAPQIYQNLCTTNPAPFSGIANLPGGTIISSSPERLVRRRGRLLETQPIAGTRPRSAHPGRDQALAKELLLHPKEQAEHIMLIDLERNDLGRICQVGSVSVDELMQLESYAYVHHIVSKIKGLTKPDLGPGAVLRAMFPGGTITGCPKVRCMEIIAELEGCYRGAYTGSMGYINRDGSLDFNILIRSLVYHPGFIEFSTGAGIVHDSEPRLELEETRAKAKGMCLAL